VGNKAVKRRTDRVAAERSRAKRSTIWLVGACGLNLATNVSLAKGWADNVPDVLVWIVWALSFSSLAWWAATHERLRKQFIKRPVIAMIVSLVIIGSLANAFYYGWPKLKHLTTSQKPVGIEDNGNNNTIDGVTVEGWDRGIVLNGENGKVKNSKTLKDIPPPKQP
jgi:hypothetical protein